MKYDIEDMRVRFWEVTDKIAEVDAKTVNLKKKTYEIRDILDPIKKELKITQAKIQEIEEPMLPELKMELATLARALGSKVGPRPESE